VLTTARDNAAAAALTIERFMAETTAELAGMVRYSPASLGAVTSTIRAGTRPQGFAFLGTDMWVANYVDGTVTKLPIN